MGRHGLFDIVIGRSKKIINKRIILVGSAKELRESICLSVGHKVL